jgi:holo-[acyl-carrier protein] synthase
MNLSVGNDIIETHRIRDVYSKFGERFLKKIFTIDEIAYCISKPDPIPFLSARFACKEAYIKAIELEDGQALDFREIELAGKNFGKKNLALHGKSKELFLKKGYTDISVSISHTENFASAIVILYKK